jgi:WD40 repeat protein
MILDNFMAPPTAAAWMSDNESFIIGSLDATRSIELWTTDGDIVFRWSAAGAGPMPTVAAPTVLETRPLPDGPAPPAPAPATAGGASGGGGGTSGSSAAASPHAADPAPLRLYDMALSRDGRRLVCAAEHAIIVFDWVTRTRIAEHRMRRGETVTSVDVSADGRQMLVSVSPDGLQLMAVDSGAVLRNFEGHAQRNFMIRSAFGGASEGFVVSGSEGLRS